MSLWAVVPAGGRGARMGAPVPKQYLPLAGRTVIEHSLLRLAAHPALRGVVVALDTTAPGWTAIEQRLREVLPVPLHTAPGGRERADSVRSALRVLEPLAAPDDWVMVHDAARPCVRREDLDALTDALAGHPVGGLLALPVVDTVKRCDALGDVVETVSRERLWRAATPQMFRLQALAAALDAAQRAALPLTDDASAMELAGLHPRIVEGHADNIKITHPGDLALAEVFLRRQRSQRERLS